MAESSSADDSPTYNVDKIIGHRIKNGVMTYKVHWEGFTSKHDSFEPPDMFLNATPVSAYLWGIINSLKDEIKKLKAE